MRTIKSGSCTQHFNVTPEGIQHHSAVLIDINGNPYCFIGFLIKDGIKQPDVIVCNGITTIGI